MNSVLLQAFTGTFWAIQESKLYAIVEFFNLRIRGETINFKAAELREAPTTAGSISVIPVVGVVSQRMNMMSDFSGGVSTEKLTRQVKQAVADPNIKAVVLDIDSPGGSVFGVQELGDYLLHTREQKPIIASVNSLAASAAYWLASCCTEICVTPSGEVGSIGVIGMHVDWSKFNEQMGIKPTYIHAGKFKSEGNPHEPLSDEALTHIQSQIDTYYDTFISAVAEGRGAPKDVVRKDFGQGRTVLAKEAVSLGMADRVETLNDTIARVSKRAPSTKRAMAELELLGKVV